MSARKQVLRLTVENGRRNEMHNKMLRKTLSSVYVNLKLEKQIIYGHVLFGSHERWFVSLNEMCSPDKSNLTIPL